MAENVIEKERKFLVKYVPALKGKPSKLKQAYLMLDEVTGRQTRVRIIDDVIAEVTYKQPIGKYDKIEITKEIDIDTANYLWNSTDIKLSKIRFTEDYVSFKVDVDFYSNGLVIAEIEYENEFPTLLPEYIGEEVTGKYKYTNIYIAKNNK